MRYLIVTALTTLLISSADSSFAKDKESEASMKMHKHMIADSEKMKNMKLSGEIDKDFATMMADHHRGGIAMAEMYLKEGSDSELKLLATEMIESQKKDLKTLEKHSSMGH